MTVSSDSGASSPRNLFGDIRSCVVDHGMPLERVLPFVTTNTATVLKLPGKGLLETGLDGDVVVIERGSLQIVEVMARENGWLPMAPWPSPRGSWRQATGAST